MVKVNLAVFLAINLYSVVWIREHLVLPFLLDKNSQLPTRSQHQRKHQCSSNAIKMIFQRVLRRLSPQQIDWSYQRDNKEWRALVALTSLGNLVLWSLSLCCSFSDTLTGYSSVDSIHFSSLFLVKASFT